MERFLFLYNSQITIGAPINEVVTFIGMKTLFGNIFPIESQINNVDAPIRAELGKITV